MSMFKGDKATRQRGNEVSWQRDRKRRWVAFLSAACLSAVGAQESLGQAGFGACCLSNGVCQELHQSTCTTDFLGVGTSCTGDVCPGACCLPDGTCVEIDGSDCFAQDGLYQGLDSVCADTTCLGSCCLPDGVCTDTGEVGCSEVGGVFQGLNTECAGTTCLGSCCLSDGFCTETGEVGCSEGGGVFTLGAVCEETPCGGACCLPLGGCADRSPAGCEQDGGLFVGFKATCGDTQCLGACCLPEKECVETGQLDCESRGGSFEGGGTVCEIDCPARLGTGFIYQGQLKRDGRPLDGTADFVFTLFNQPVGGEILGELEFVNRSVVNGLFTVELDFGASALDGNARWLEIEVRSPSGAGKFTVLDPRRPLTPTPYAVQTRGVVVDAARRVGIGAKTPTARLHVEDPTNMPAQPGVESYVPFKIANGGSQALLFDSNQIESAGGPLHLNHRGDGAGHDVIIANGGGNVTIAPGGVGNVSIGGVTPVRRLTVGGAALLIPTGAESVPLTVNGGDANSTLRVEADHQVYVSGDFFVSGGTKNFLVDHPLDPANKRVAHNAVEGPGMYTLYRGNAVLDGDGEAWVELPEYFDALNTEPTYHLTCVGGYAPVYVAEEIRENRFRIAGGREGLKVSWQIIGLRNDPWARDHPYEAVIEKEDAECGRYYYPEGYGMPKEMGIGRLREAAARTAGDPQGK